MTGWTERQNGWTMTAAGTELTVVPQPLALRAVCAGVEIALGDGDAYPAAPVAVRRDGRWGTPLGTPTVISQGNELHLTWPDAVTLVIAVEEDGAAALHLDAPDADAVALAIASAPDEH